jgi:hypothetical protein
MKQCPKCHRRYEDDSLRFCLDDGTSLVSKAARSNEVRTEVLPGSRVTAPTQQNLNFLPWIIAGAAVLLVLVMGIGLVVTLIASHKSNTSGVNSNGSNYNGTGPSSSQTRVTPTPVATMNVAGTTWAGMDSTKVHNEYVFSANGLVWDNPHSTWQQTGNTVVWDLNDKYAHYEGTVNGDHMEYQAHNKVGFSWTGSLTRTK